jgi:hypothetical protein
LIASIGGVIALGLAAAVVFVVQGKDKAAQIAAWTPVGPACQPVTKQAFTAFGATLSGAIVYNGVRFARASGYQRCGDIPGDDGHGLGKIAVCQFSDPTALQVTTPKGDFYFLPGSQPATVSVTRDQPNCIMAVNTDPNWFRN